MIDLIFFLLPIRFVKQNNSVILSILYTKNASRFARKKGIPNDW